MRNDAKIAGIARRLSEALQDWAYTRKDDDRKRALSVQIELINATKEEAADVRPDAHV